MIAIRNITLGLLLLAWAATGTLAQDHADPRPAAPQFAVTISATAKGLRVTALGDVRQIRFEVFGEGGDSFFNSGFKAGNIFDWGLKDAQGVTSPDGIYRCVVTFTDVMGGVWTKQGSVLIQAGRPSLRLGEGVQPDVLMPAEARAAATTDDAEALTLTAHDGGSGRVVSTTGGFTFSAGDFFAGRDRELMRLTPDGDLGVGVSSPTAKLDVAGAVRARGGIVFGDGTVLTSARGAAAAGTSANADAATAAAAIGGSGTANKLAKWLDASGTLGDSVLSEAGGQVGIGTATPTAALDVVYNNNTFGFGFNMRNSNTGPQALVGYGIDNAAGSRVGQFVYASNNYTNAALRDTLLFSSAGPTTALGFVTSADGSGTPDLFFRAGVGADIMRLKGASGFVGIGTSAPTERLEVNGNLKVTGSAVVDGNIAAKYQDVAEWVRAREPLAAGTVVTLDPKHVNTVRASARPYDTQVAGVVSAQPGVILGEGGDGKVMVATTGRVRVRVDATRRPIRVGDLLVTGGGAGEAIRSLPVRVGRTRLHRPGTIIGKALEPLAKGKGEILVLLSLQ